jgi:transcriptional regulator with XRE-family HTH domain
MKDRLLKFMGKEELSSARFAEIIGVQPSSISHILSGRNKPGFDLIHKILINFPALNADWLITGKGHMYKLHAAQMDLFSDTPDATPRHPVKSEENPSGRDVYGNNQDSGILDTFVNKGDDSDDYKSDLGVDSGVTNVNGKKVVDKIVIFYKDKSFDDYFPA